MKHTVTLRETVSLLGFALLALPSVAGAASADNTKLGIKTLQQCTVVGGCTDNVAIGVQALQGPNVSCTGHGAPFPCCTGVQAGTCAQSSNASVAVGRGALAANRSGFYNNAVGALALTANTSGDQNNALGHAALGVNTSGSSNTALGDAALASNTGSDMCTGPNTPFGCCAGPGAGFCGSANSAVGPSALFSNTIGFHNSALGFLALASNTTGGDNTAVGEVALFGNSTGNGNTAVGTAALGANTAGQVNIAVGLGALSFNSTGSGNIGVGGGGNLTTGDNNIDIGNQGVAGESSHIRIGDPAIQTATFIAGIRGVSTGVANGVAVLVDSNGQLGTISSSQRFKTAIRDMGDHSSKVMQLRPVTFRYKPDIDPSGTIQYGLIAEEVAKVLPELVARDKNGDIETVKYQLLDPLLLNELQKQARRLDAQAHQIREQTRVMRAQAQQIETLTVQARQIETLAARLTQLETVVAPAHAPALGAASKTGAGL